jgi:hypothetical protein
MDLKRHLELVRKGVLSKRSLRPFLKWYAEARAGPICCFFVKSLREVVDDDDDYINMKTFDQNGCGPDDLVIGCSRGCMAARDWNENEPTFKETFCKVCIEEVKTLLASSSKSPANSNIPKGLL